MDTASMRRRQSKRPSIPVSPIRLIVGSATALLLAWCGWSLLCVDAEYGPPLGPDRILADGNLGGDTPAMQARARQALRYRPIDGNAFRVLGQGAARHGESVRADTLYRIAIRRDPRDWQAHAFLMDAAFKRGDVEEGGRHLDAILRVAPSLATPLLEALAPELGDGRLRAAVVDVVANQPPWAGRMVAALRTPSMDPANAAAFIEDLSRRRPLSPTERSALIDALSRAGRASEARIAWLATLPTGERALAGNVFDGGFEEIRPIAGEFAWSWDPGTGVDMSIEQSNAASGQQSLRIDFNGRAMSLRAPAQRLALAPGRYMLSVAFDDRTNAPRPFTMQVACMPGDELTRLELADGTQNAWKHTSGSFEVPQNCPQQRIWLSLRVRSLADTQVSGALRLDDVEIRNSLQ